LNLIVAHQYIEQLDERVAAAIFGNVGTFIIFRVGAADAEELVKEFTPLFVEEDLVNLPKYHIYLKLMIDGVASDPFSAMTLPPVAKESGSEENIIKVTREHYGRPREIVEDKISRWSGVETEEMIERLEKKLEHKKEQEIFDKKIDFLASFRGEVVKEDSPAIDQPKATESAQEKKDEELFIVKCSSCGGKTKINFKPDGQRPVFCKDCLKEYRRKQALNENLKKKQSSFQAKIKPAVSRAPASSVKELTMSDALTIGPKDFKGRKIDVKSEDINRSYKELTGQGDLAEELKEDDLSVE
jgi:CxxC-x17-CxxC domain-containing protein